MTNINYEEIMSPCKNICTPDVDFKYCIGCFRTIEEKKNWFKLTKDEKLVILEEIKKGHNRFHPTK
jgi:hypothetical protein